MNLLDIGEILDRKDRFVERKHSVLKCNECKATYTRDFKVGDYTFKKLTDEECNECKKSKWLTIEEIYSEWKDPKKKK
ncbi:MAG: hypothetical protein EAX89_16365 [Candidatus Lokiarchaeota archaeon]|nr:hypothetical protein [Candidatus Lokiarchaeota archaeon]